MTNVRLNPQPEPPSPKITIITGSVELKDTCEIVTGAGVLEVNFKTRKVTLKYPEKEPHGGWLAANALGAAINTWHDAKNVKGFEELHKQAEQLVVCSVEAVIKAAASR